MTLNKSIWNEAVEIYLTYFFPVRSRDSSVGIANGYGLDGQGVAVRVPVESRIFSSPRLPNQLWGSPSLISNGYQGVVSTGVKRPRREADHSAPNTAEVKKMWLYTFTPP
jgi:hypothetical protein